MQSRHAEIAAQCLTGSEAGSMTFPQILALLTKEGFEGYQVDFRRGFVTYYAPETCIDLPIHALENPVAHQFDAAAVRAAIGAAQSLTPGYTYLGFCNKIAAAGCTGYLVSLPGRRVVYVGRTGETHVERMPD